MRSARPRRAHYGAMRVRPYDRAMDVVTRQPKRGGSVTALAGINQRMVAECIRRHRSGISRTEIADLTGLSPQTVGNVARRLLSQGIIHEAGLAQTGLGKPRTLLQLQPDGMFTLGVHLDPDVLDLTLLDLSGEVVASVEGAMPVLSDPVDVLASVAGRIGQLLDDHGVREKVAGVGVAAPGPIDHTRHTMVDPPLMPTWRQVAVEQILGEQLGLPVLLEKDVLAAAQGELWLNPAPEEQSFVFLYLGTGVGLGLVQRGRLLRGATGNAGDIGHLQMAAPAVPACPICGGRHVGLALSPVEWIRYGCDHALLDPVVMNGAGVAGAVRELCEQALRGVPAAALLMEVVAQALATTLAVASDLLDLNGGVLGGPYWALVEEAVMPRVRDQLGGMTVLGSVRPVAVRTSVSGATVGSVGAAALAMNSFFAS